MSKPKKRLTQETPKSREKPLGERDLGIEIKEVGVPFESNQFSSLLKSDSSSLEPWSKPYRPINLESISDVCGYLSEGLSFEGACALSFVRHETVEAKANSGKKSYAWLRSALSWARRKSESVWQSYLTPKSLDEHSRTANAQVKAAMFMLGAIDKERYRENYQSTGAQVLVQILQGGGRGDPANMVQVQVKDSSGNQIKSNKRDSIDGQGGRLSPIGLPEITVRNEER